MLKKFLTGITALAAAAALSACSGETAKIPEKLKIGCEDGGYAPFEFYDENGKITGIDIELGQLIAEKAGMEYELVLTDWDGIFDGMERGDYDCIMSAITISDERREKYDFSSPYIQNYQCIVAMKDSGTKPESPDGIGGLRVGYQEETTSEEFINSYAEKNSISFSPSPYSKLPDIFADLKAGRLDVLICDSTVAAGYLGDDSGFELTWVQKSDPEEFGICIKKGNSALVEKINAALAELKSEGKVDQLLNKYF